MTAYWVVGNAVLDYVDEFAPDDVHDEFYDLLEVLATGPYPEDQPEAGIMPMREPTKPNGFTAPFDAGLLAYQVMLDQPVVALVDVFWVDDTQGLGQSF